MGTEVTPRKMTNQTMGTEVTLRKMTNQTMGTEVIPRKMTNQIMGTEVIPRDGGNITEDDKFGNNTFWRSLAEYYIKRRRIFFLILSWTVLNNSKKITMKEVNLFYSLILRMRIKMIFYSWFAKILKFQHLAKDKDNSSFDVVPMSKG